MLKETEGCMKIVNTVLEVKDLWNASSSWNGKHRFCNNCKFWKEKIAKREKLTVVNLLSDSWPKSGAQDFGWKNAEISKWCWKLLEATRLLPWINYKSIFYYLYLASDTDRKWRHKMFLTVNHSSISSRKPGGSDFWIGRSINIVTSSKGRYIENLSVCLFLSFCFPYRPVSGIRCDP